MLESGLMSWVKWQCLINNLLNFSLYEHLFPSPGLNMNWHHSIIPYRGMSMTIPKFFSIKKVGLSKSVLALVHITGQPYFSFKNLVITDLMKSLKSPKS